MTRRPDDLFLRSPNDHKGRFGRLLVIGGARGMVGAAVLAGSAALRGGAGLVRLATPLESQHVAAAVDPCLMTVGLPQSAKGVLSWTARKPLAEQAAWADVIALGPGLGRSFAQDRIVADAYQQWPQPMVVDADALNALASGPPLAAGGPRVLTPHAGEFARIARAAGVTASDSEQAVHRVAKTWQAVVVLKGHRTWIVDADGASHRNTTGNPGMATAGSGDVLTGVIAALLGQGLSAPWAARCGALVHGWAGDLAAAALGEISMTAKDLVEYLPQAFQQWGSSLQASRDADDE